MAIHYKMYGYGAIIVDRLEYYRTTILENGGTILPKNFPNSLEFNLTNRAAAWALAEMVHSDKNNFRRQRGWYLNFLWQYTDGEGKPIVSEDGSRWEWVECVPPMER